MKKVFRFSVLRSVFTVWAGLAASCLALAAPSPNNLHLASVSAVVMPLDASKPLYAKRSNWVMPIASITKMMTAMVTLDSGAPLDEWLPVVKRHFPAAANAYSRIRRGSEAKRGDLLKVALMSSENYAAYLLARHNPKGYDAFIRAMNAKAKKLGMINTHFVDSSGLSSQNVSTTADLAKMLKAAYTYPAIREATTTGRYDMHFKSPHYSLYYANTDPLVRSSRWHVLLSKTGYLDEAGRCLIVLVNIDDKPTLITLLDSFGKRSPLGDVGRIRRWLTLGKSGSVARAAARYEVKKARSLQTDSYAQKSDLTASDTAVLP